MRRLIITNGSSGVEAIARAGIEGEILSWDDVLHDGPVPLTNPEFQEDQEPLKVEMRFESPTNAARLESPTVHSLSSLSDIRAEFLSERGVGSYQEIRARFRKRDSTLLAALDRPEVVCWFEHDLYDQLQVWQILSTIAELRRQNPGKIGPTTFSCICDPVYVSYQTNEQLEKQFLERQPVKETMFSDASALWDAFRDSNPQAMAQLHGKTTLRFADDTIGRWKGLFPSSVDGLDQVERETLFQLAATGRPMEFGELFRAVPDQEGAIFMGDRSFEWALKRMASGDKPLLRIEPIQPESDLNEKSDGPPEFLISITTQGLKRLESPKRWEKNDIQARWVGGVRISSDNLWSFHPDRMEPVRLSSS